MFALIASIFIFLAAFGVELGTVNLLYVGLGFWALHFAFGIALPVPTVRRVQ